MVDKPEIVAGSRVMLVKSLFANGKDLRGATGIVCGTREQEILIDWDQNEPKTKLGRLALPRSYFQCITKPDETERKFQPGERVEIAFKYVIGWTSDLDKYYMHRGRIVVGSDGDRRYCVQMLVDGVCRYFPAASLRRLESKPARFDNNIPSTAELEAAAMPAPTFEVPQMLTAPVKPLRIEQRTFVNGTDISDLSDNALFNLISEAEDEIRKLEAIENKPKRLRARIDDLRKGIKELVRHLDAKDAPATKATTK